MMMKLTQVALLVAGGLAIAGCQLDKAKTAAPVKKAPAGDYALIVPAGPPPANLRAVCYNANDINTIRGRMFHQEMVVAVLQCQTPSGSRAFDSIYASYLGKFGGELSANARALTDLSRRKRFNIDTVVTEFSNRTAQRAPVDKDYCARNLRALEWALDPKVTSLSQTPPPYDLGPEMNMLPCPAP
ncbi:MAG: hypothetical protein JSR24_11290 [Proteobacteria bacterium]|nr:hypothetical protein [Pseudomonadota bacterium]